MSIAYILFLALCFLAVVMLLEGLYLTWNAHLGPEARRIEQRLRAISAAGDRVETPLVKKRMLSDVPALERLLMQLPRVHVLDRFLLQSALDITVATFLGVAFALAFAAALALAVADAPWWVCVVGAALAAATWVQFVQIRRVRRMRQIGQQLPDALDLMGRAMQAGHAFSSALRMVGTEGSQPIAGEFRTTFDEINFGIPFDQALAHLAQRVASEELRFFVVAVLIQRETGGNLAEILASIAALLRDRQKLAGTVRVLSAEGRLSAWILTLLPFGLAGVIFMIHREFISILWNDPIGVRAVGIALALMAFGIWWMWRLTRIRV
jgi:tight adherence protein B